MSEISIFLLVSVAEQAGLNLTLSETLKTGFRSPYTMGQPHLTVFQTLWSIKV